MTGRDFLLFIPGHTPNLRAILSYYDTTATVNPDGDVHINEILDGLGTALPFHSRLYKCFKRPSSSYQPSCVLHATKLKRSLWTRGSTNFLHFMLHEDHSTMEWMPLTLEHERGMTCNYFYVRMQKLTNFV
jgi:hypothetical protein